MQNRPRVGEILVSAGIIDEMQLEAALGEQKQWGRRLGVTLIKMGMVEEGHRIRALAKQLDLPVASLAGKRIPEEVIALVPSRVASEHGVIPLFTKDGGRNGQLYLGMEDPSNLAVLDDLSFRTGMEIHPVMVGPTELGEAIDRYYHAREGGAPQRDPFKNGDTMNPGSLRVVTDDSPQPGTAPAEPSIEAEIQAAAAPRPAAASAPPIELQDAVPTPAEATSAAPPTQETTATAPSASTTAPASAPVAAIPEAVHQEIARMGEALEALQADLSGVTEEMTAVQGTVSAFESDLGGVRGDLANALTSKEADEDALAPVKEHVARLSGEVGRLDESIERLRDELARVSEATASLPALNEASAQAVHAGTTATEVANRASEESERTRIVAKAITTLLVEKGVLGLEALQAQISLLKAAAEVDDDADFEPLDG